MISCSMARPSASGSTNCIGKFKLSRTGRKKFRKIFLGSDLALTSIALRAVGLLLSSSDEIGPCYQAWT